MAVGLIVDFLLLLFIVQAWTLCGPHQPKVVGAVGGVVCLSPSPGLQGKFSLGHWRRNGTLKLAIWSEEEKALYFNTPYKGRLEIFPNYTLKISHLQKNDSSTYKVYLEDHRGLEHTAEVTLTVYDLVPKPLVTATVTKGDQQQCNATLECLVGLPEVTYEWIPPRQIRLEGGVGPVQKVSFNPSEGTYTCKVSNPASSNSASLTYRHPCSWTGESSTATSFTTTSGLVALGHLLLLFFHLALA